MADPIVIRNCTTYAGLLSNKEPGERQRTSNNITGLGHNRPSQKMPGFGLPDNPVECLFEDNRRGSGGSDSDRPKAIFAKLQLKVPTGSL